MHRVFSNLLWYETRYKSIIVTEHPFYVLCNALHEIERIRSCHKYNLFFNVVFDMQLLLQCLRKKETSEKEN